MAGYTFFGVQVAAKAFYNDPFRRRLHEAIAAAPETQSLRDKRAFWKTISALLNEAWPVFELGYWDLVRGANAEEEFETWTSEIEGSVATEPAEMGAAADEATRLSADKGYVLVSALVLVSGGSNSDLTLGDRCDLPETTWWTRQTFERLVSTFPLLNFGQVQADAVYLVPGNDRDGLSTEDLRGEGYKYLQPLG
jgi:hypothetical protein